MKKIKKDSFIGVRLPTEVHIKLDKIAQEQDLSVAWIVRKAIVTYLEQNFEKKGKNTEKT